MATENTKETVTYLIQVRGPNGEEERCAITPSENPTVLRQKISLSPKFTTYTAFHFEVENLKGGDDLVLDENTPFSAIPLIGNNSTLLLVPDMYNAKTIRYQIKYSIAMLSNKFPVVSQIVKFNADELPENLKEYTKQITERAKLLEEKKEAPPVDLKERVNETLKEGDIAFKEAALAQGESFPADDLTILAKLREAVAGEEKISIKSLSISSYNPPTASRLAMGDLIYLRMQTSENNVFHITGNASGFFANQSTDSVFNPAENADYPTIYPTLPAILCSLSSGFKSWFLKHRQVARSSNISSIVRSLPLMPNLVSSTKGWFSDASGEDSGNLFDYADLMMDEALPVTQLKTTESTRWLNEYNIVRSMKGMDIATSMVISKEQSFASAAVHACKKIVDEGIQSLFLNKDTEPCYIVDDIFITSVAPKGSDVITPANCNEEIANTRFLNSLDIEGLFTGLTTVVDYKGHRFLAQSAVPGIVNMSATNMIMWGSVDEGMTIHTDERIKPIISKIAEEAHWTESKVHAIKPANPIVDEEPIPAIIPEPPASETFLTDNQEGTILGPVEGRIVRGTDNRLYAADYLHIAPVDIAWREAHAKLYPEEKPTTLTVRRQLVVQWLLRLALLKEQVKAMKDIIERKEKGEEVKDVEEKDLPEMKKTVEMTEKEIAGMPTAFDVNAFTRYAVEDKTAEENVRLLCSLIHTTVIPSMVNSLNGDNAFYADTENIVALIHSSGLNARYLGAIAEKITNEVAKEQIEREMVARAAKHILREILNDEVLSGASAFAVTAFLNGLLCDARKKEVLLTGKNKKSKKVPSLVSQHILKKGLTSENIWNMIDEEVKHHFHYTLTIWGKKGQDAALRLLLLRRVCQQNGICLQAQQYDLNDTHVLRVENIIDFVPRVKFANTPNLDQKCSEVHQGAQSLMDQLQLEDAYEVTKRCLIQIISAHSQLHPQMLSLLNTMKNILVEVNDITMALECCRAALYCSDAINGCDSLESARLHTELAALLFRQQCYYESIIHSKIAVAVYSLLNGAQSTRVKEVMLNMGMGYMNVGKLEEAIRCFDMVMTLEKGNAYLNACYYGCVINAKLKKMEESAQYKKSLEEALATEDETFRKTMLESLEKSLKELK